MEEVGEEAEADGGGEEHNTSKEEEELGQEVVEAGEDERGVHRS